MENKMTQGEIHKEATAWANSMAQQKEEECWTHGVIFDVDDFNLYREQMFDKKFRELGGKY